MANKKVTVVGIVMSNGSIINDEDFCALVCELWNDPAREHGAIAPTRTHTPKTQPKVEDKPKAVVKTKTQTKSEDKPKQVGYTVNGLSVRISTHSTNYFWALVNSLRSAGATCKDKVWTFESKKALNAWLKIQAQYS